jgi:ribosomal protein S18 acetylase RimI-like enzyme
MSDWRMHCSGRRSSSGSTEVQFHRPTLLDTDKHRRDEFTCGETTLDDWLRRYAGQNRRGNTAAVWVITDANQKVVCNASLSMTSVDRSASPRPLGKGAPRQIPALLIGRLATDTCVAGLGLGTEMVKHILATAAELNIKAACRAVVVTALNAEAFGWWQRFGFEPLGADDPANLDLYLLTKDITETLASL